MGEIGVRPRFCKGNQDCSSKHVNGGLTPISFVYCRKEGTGTQVDHAIPKARGGDATLENAQMACPHCNASKGARDFPVNPPPGYRGEWPPSHW
ncbi:HNH endonuclease signature motif containing protein [Pseudomonas sp. MF6747]|uniref:HNH endonuclease n=1 Tax=Pseudomonas sp. MF6747 TaxID=2797527 RepID=UPI001909A41E|nr:HNH endonuclease [Pseudomonas sp. MF6747]